MIFKRLKNEIKTIYTQLKLTETKLSKTSNIFKNTIITLVPAWQGESSSNINCVYACWFFFYLVELGPSLVELLIVDGILQRSPHLVPFLVLRQLLLLILQRVKSLLDVLQQLVDLLPLSLCKQTNK